MTLPTDSKARKNLPVATGVLDYFPDALVELAGISFDGNEKHNPGEPLGWSREKSKDHDDCLIRHFLERGTLDDDGSRHSAKMAWRALAILQLEIERDVQPAGPLSPSKGWIPWNVGLGWSRPPLPSGTKVLVMFRNGESVGVPVPTDCYGWSDLEAGTVVAYKVVSDDDYLTAYPGPSI